MSSKRALSCSYNCSTFVLRTVLDEHEQFYTGKTGTESFLLEDLIGFYLHNYLSPGLHSS